MRDAVWEERARGEDQKLPGPIAGRAGFPFVEPPGRDLYDVCVHCGFCLPACPTYQETGLEELSPRGRVFLIRAAGEGLLDFRDPALRVPVETCLDCRACEVVCPSGVQVGLLVERTRGQMHQNDRREGAKPPLAVRALARTLTLRHGPAAVAVFGRLYQKRMRQTRAGKSGDAARRGVLGRLVEKLPRPLKDLEAVMPPVTGQLTRTHAPERIEAQGVYRGRVAFFAGCVGDALFQQTNQATLSVLARNGYEVVIERGQGCCGGLARDLGDRSRARELARDNLDCLGRLDVERIVTNQGGCGAMLSEYPDLFPDDPAMRERAEAFSAKVVDVAQLLCEKGFDPPRHGPSPALRVTYQASCHLTNVLGVSEEPRALLRSIPGVEFVEMREPARCCGSAGVYNLMEPDMAYQLLDGKMESMPPGVDVVATGNPGCALWMRVGRARSDRSFEILHPVELLERAYRMDDAVSDGAGGATGPR